MMKKCCLSLLVFYVLLSLPCFAEQGEFPLFFTPEANLTIDGSRDEWPATVPFVLESETQVRSGKRETPEAFSLKAWYIFDSTNLYLFVDAVDPAPLQNQHAGNDLYRGDSLEVYLGFHEEVSPAYGPDDFQFGIGLGETTPVTWIWTNGQELSGQDIAVVTTPQGFAVEARIPLSNFARNSIKAGDPVWIDFGANNDNGEGERAVQMIWHGDGTGWQTPQVWQKGRLIDTADTFNAAYILAPAELLTETFHRVYVWNAGQPWEGIVSVGEQQLATDERGGFDLVVNTAGTLTVAADIDGTPVTTDMNIKQKQTQRWIDYDVKAVKVNQAGYQPDERKEFLLAVEEGAELASKEFTVTSSSGKKVYFTGVLSDSPIQDKTTGDWLYYGDFSEFSRPGKYRILVEGFKKSFLFAIGDDVLSKVFYATMRSYYLHRCGIAIDDTHSKVAHEACHLEDGVLKGDPDTKIDVAGGWHDAGDYGKYMPTAGVTVAQLLLMYELMPEKFTDFSLDLPESENQLPDVLDEIRYELDWMLKMQESSGGVHHKVNTINFPGMIVPEEDTQQRFIYEIGTAGTAIFSGATALAARVFETVDADYAATLREAAVKAGEFLLANQGKEVFWPSKDNTGDYRTQNVSDELFWAFAELSRLTGDRKYLDVALPLYDRNAQELSGFDWGHTQAFGVYTLAVSETTPAELQETFRDALLKNAETVTALIQRNGYRVSLKNEDYVWSSNKVACSKGINLILAYELFGNEAFKQAARYQLDYVLGVNTLSKSFITGIGNNPVRYPHHRLVEATKTMIPGMVVGGPNNKAEDGTYEKGLLARGYRDRSTSYASNEYAIDYNAPVVFLTGYFMNRK